MTTSSIDEPAPASREEQQLMAYTLDPPNQLEHLENARRELQARRVAS
jgi:hypothetical protein